MTKAKLLADFIKNRRTKLGYTQTELAAKVGVSRQSVSVWEMGDEVESVKSTNLAALEKALKCKPGELLRLYYSD